MKQKLPFKVKLAYGLSGYSSFITWTIFSFYGLYFFTDVVGFTAAFAGSIISLGTLWDAITDPVIGALSDNVKSEKGRRRPLIIGIAVPFALVSILLFTDFAFSESVSKIYFIVIILAYYTIQTILDISSSALGSEMTLDYDERSSLATYKNFFCMAVVIIVSPTLMLTSYFGRFFQNHAFGWSCTLALYMVFALLCIVVLWKTTKGYERYESDDTGIKLKNFREVFRNRPAKIVMAIFALGVFGNTANLSLQVYYFGHYVRMTDAQIAAVMTVSGIAACIAAFGVDFLCQKFSKKAAWLLAVGLEAASMILFIGFLIHPGQVVLVYILFLLMSLGTCAIYQVPWSMIPDCVDVNLLISEKRIDGLVFGLVAFLQKVSGAIAIALVGIALTAIDYQAGQTQDVKTLEALKFLYGFGCGGIFLISLVLALKYPLSRKRHAEFLTAITEKQEGKEIDREKFKDLIGVDQFAAVSRPENK